MLAVSAYLMYVTSDWLAVEKISTAPTLVPTHNKSWVTSIDKTFKFIQSNLLGIHGVSNLLYNGHNILITQLIIVDS